MRRGRGAIRRSRERALNSASVGRYWDRMSDEADSTIADPVAIAIGTRITLERERLGLTKEELGTRSGLPSRYVWRVEAARVNVQLRNLSKIAIGLGLTVSELTSGLEELIRNPLNRPKPKRRGPLPRSRKTAEDA